MSLSLSLIHILQYYTTERNVTFYADRLGLTLSYFSTCIKKAIGQTPLEVLTQIIIIDAKVQLKGTNQEIKNIAMELGFTNLSFFNKFFRHHVGITPVSYTHLICLLMAVTVLSPPTAWIKRNWKNLSATESIQPVTWQKTRPVHCLTLPCTTKETVLTCN